MASILTLPHLPANFTPGEQVPLARLPLFEGWEAAKVFIFSKGIAKVFTTNWIAAGVFPLVHSA